VIYYLVSIFTIVYRFGFMVKQVRMYYRSGTVNAATQLPGRCFMLTQQVEECICM